MLEEARNMDKKLVNRNSPVPLKTNPVDRKSDNVRFQRNNKKKENGGRIYQEGNPTKKPAPQKNRSASDKRPRIRGNFNDKSRNEVADQMEAELDSILNQNDLSHMINFDYGTRRGRSAAYHHFVRRPRYVGPIFNKQQYLQANCQFVVKDSGDYSIHTTDPDKPLDWDTIEQVRMSSPELPLCPICLSRPMAGKITKCGHIYCWSCILHYLALSEKKWHRCPICNEPIYQKDLKSVKTTEVTRYQTGDKICLTLMRRQKGSTIPVARAGWQGPPSKPCNVKETEKVCFSKVLLASTHDVQELVTDIEDKELLLQMSNAEESEVCFIESAMEQQKVRIANLTQPHTDEAQQCLQSNFGNLKLDDTLSKEPEPLLASSKAMTEYIDAFDDKVTPGARLPTACLPDNESSQQPESLTSAVMLSNTSPSSPVMLSDSAPSSTATLSDTETAPTSPVMLSVSAPKSAVMLSESAPKSAAMLSETAPKSAAMLSDLAPKSAAMLSDLAPKSAAMLSETAPISTAMLSETAPISAALLTGCGGPIVTNLTDYETMPTEMAALSLELPHHATEEKQEHRRGMQANTVKDTFYFYQASDGQPIYLHAVNARCLAWQYGSLENSPDSIVATIVEVESIAMTQELRNRLRYLNHLPLSVEFKVVEVLLSPPVVSKDTLKEFSDIIKNRARCRQRKVRQEKQRLKMIEEENSKYRPGPVTIVMSSAAEIHSMQQHPQTSFPQLVTGDPTFDLPVTLDLPSPDPTPEYSGKGNKLKKKKKGNTSPLPPPLPPVNEENRTSFAQKLKSGKLRRNQVSVCGPAGAGAPPAQRGPGAGHGHKYGSDSEISDSDGSVPNYNNSFCAALDTLRHTTGSTPHSTKKKKMKMLFSTTMARVDY